jgi:hypothetical protein
MCRTVNYYTYTVEGSDKGGREEGEEDGGQENDTCTNVSSD